MKRPLPHAFVWFAALVTAGAFGGAATANDYDIVILNGRVLDPESKFDGVKNVGE